nr:glutathione S-transferase sigma 4 [Ectropis grisescens]
MTKILRYFELNGLAEAIRYILHYTGQKFEDVRYDHTVWPIKEVKDALPFGKMPLLEDGDKVLHQSLAIARYVSANTELLPSDAWEQAQLDAIVYTIYDFDKHVINFIHATTPEEKAKYKKILYDEHLDFYFSRFEKLLQNNNGYFGGKLSWTDFVFVGIIECANLFLEEELQKGYPAITKLMETIPQLPKVKEYVANRTPYVKW